MLKNIVLLCGILFFVLLVIGAWTLRPISATHPAIANAKLPQIIPLRDFYANRDSKWGYSLSRDGSKLAWLEIEWFKRVLKVKDLASGKTQTIKIPDHKGQWRYYWTPNGNSMLIGIDRTGRENYELAINNLDDEQDEWRFFDFGLNTSTFIQSIPKTESDEIVIAHNAKDSAVFDMYHLDLKSGETAALGASLQGQQVSYAINDNGEIFGRTIWPERERSSWRFEVGNPQDGWKEVARGDFQDMLNLFGTLIDDKAMYGISNLGMNTTALVKFDLDTGDQEIIFQDEKVDVGWVNLDPVTNNIQMVKTYREIVEQKIFDKAFEQDIRRLNTGDTTEVFVRSQTLDGLKSIYHFSDPIHGSKTVLLDREKQRTEILTSPTLNKYRDRLSQPEAIFVKARDGIEIPTYLYRPKGVAGAAPTVMIVHGGPISRTYANSDKNFIALLNNHGYAVLDVNYRGSSGYGRKFIEAAKGEIAGKMSSDIIDVRTWAVEQGIADPDKIGIFGISWGGFEVMTALTQNSDLFAAGININGVADLSTMLDEVPDYWRGWQEWLIEYAGDPSTEEGLKELQSRSPLYNANKMKTPLMIVQAGNDVRVVKGQSDRMVTELNQSNAPFEYTVVPGVGHSPFGWPWQRKYLLYRDIEHFLAKHLGGRTGGYDYAILGAHILPE